ncbi:MAG: hypothetical protein PF485_08330 [Bacteroidales bacterium]|jgi:hypothetical protein|nr:hypothetical protein [Bacteroidales bacterium]
MRKLILVFIIGVVALSTTAQEYLPTETDLNQFLNSKLYVVLETNPIAEYNFKIQDAVKKTWTLTDYEFISYKQFEEMYNDPNKSFLMMTQVIFQNDKTKVRYNFLHIFIGKEGLDSFEELPDIASIPLSYKEVDEEFWVYKMESLVRFLQTHIQNMKENPDMIKKNIFQYYNENTKDIKQKTLYLVKDEVAPNINTESKIKKIYPYKVKFVTRNEIEEAITNRDENVVYLHKVGPLGTRLRARCYKIIIGAKDANFYYFNYHWVEKGKNFDGILDKDFKKLTKKK